MYINRLTDPTNCTFNSQAIGAPSPIDCLWLWSTFYGKHFSCSGQIDIGFDRFFCVCVWKKRQPPNTITSITTIYIAQISLALQFHIARRINWSSGLCERKKNWIANHCIQYSRWKKKLVQPRCRYNIPFICIHARTSNPQSFKRPKDRKHWKSVKRFALFPRCFFSVFIYVKPHSAARRHIMCAHRSDSLAVRSLSSFSKKVFFF